jgi:hypothetical protein
MRHVVWDRNGTLLADQELVVDVLNTVLAGVTVKRRRTTVSRSRTASTGLWITQSFGGPA